MIDIKDALYNILHSRYGRDVRQSIHDGIYQINENANEAVQTAKAMGVGTDISSPTSSSTGYVAGNLYLNNSTWDLWQCIGTDSWVNKGNIKGATGVKGADGVNYYIHIRYSDKYDGTGFTASPTASSEYMGVYYGTSQTAPTNKQDYQWTSYVGASGTSAYVHIMYSENADGSNFVSVPTPLCKYIGFYSGSLSSPPANKSYYTWSEYVGKSGTGSGDMTSAEYAPSGVYGKVDNAINADNATNATSATDATNARNLKKSDGTTVDADSITTKLSKVDIDENVSAALEKKIDKPASATNGQVLTYNGTSNEWEAQDSKGGNGKQVKSCEYAIERWLRFDPSNRKGLIIKAGTSIRNSQGSYIDFDTDTAIDLTSAITTVGKDYYVYMLDDGSITAGITSASAPSNSVRIGRFHSLCVAVGTCTMIVPPSGIAVGSNYLVKSYRQYEDADFFNLYNKSVTATGANNETLAHPLSGFEAGAILPESVMCLSFHSGSLFDDGQVYDKDIDAFIDIYLQSGIGLNTRSKYGATHTVSRAQGNHMVDMRQVGKKLLSDGEFESASIGSNQATNITGSKDQTTVGGHVDTANRRMISAIGVEEMCGYIWQWTRDVSSTGSSSWATTDGNGSFGQEYGTPYVLLAGGDCSGGSRCGSRSRFSAAVRSHVAASIGGRGLSRVVRGV